MTASNSDQPANRLIDEPSPYLRQHAHNPVDWYPWGAEAFDRARVENKPIFLSIGYATCHWCHVMAHESFEDLEVAQVLNDNFICIKVDREERPDIDHVYMTVCQMMTGHGGWPLTIIMTPDQKPCFAATYIPKSERFGRPGLMEILPGLAAAYHDEPERIEQLTASVMDALRNARAASAGAEPDATALERALTQLRGQFDATHGGFGPAPKFPSPHQLTFILSRWHRTKQQSDLHMVVKTLTEMRLGGIYDHVGFGFHRYSTDEQWRVPHFEKMLYDQATLMAAYTAGWQATGNPLFARTANEIAEYVLRDLTSVEGGFYSAEDADSEGEEGLFYFWEQGELAELLDEDENALVQRMFNIQAAGNFAAEPSRQADGKNIFYLDQLPAQEDAVVWSLVREKLLAARSTRIRPLLDDKILTDWNSIMISALARAGQALNRPEYIEAAQNAAEFLLDNLYHDGRLLHRYHGGQAGIPAFHDDYALFIAACLDLYEATFEIHWLQTAKELTATMINLFWDQATGGFLFTAHDADSILIRTRQTYDGALPSGNSAAALGMLRLARMTADTEIEKRVALLFRSMGKLIEQSPTAYTALLTAVDFALGPAHEIVIAGDPQAHDTHEMLQALRKAYLPAKVILLRTDEDAQALQELVPFTASQTTMDGRATAYVCQNYACAAPTTEVEVMLAALGI